MSSFEQSLGIKYPHLAEEALAGPEQDREDLQP